MMLQRSWMLGLLAGLVCATTAVGAAATGQQRAESAGQSLLGTPAPRLVLKTIDGETVDLGQLYGKQAVYLKFWATWCVPCREQMPHFERTYEGAGADLAVIAVDTGFNETVQDVKDYRSKLGIKMPIVVDDGQLARALHLRVTPQHIVIGRDGRILYVGHLADARLEAALVAARTSAGSPGAGKRAPPVSRWDSRHFAVGDQLPAESLPTIDGRSFALRPTAQSQRTVLVFLSPWCESYLATTRPALSAGCRRMREEVSVLAAEPQARWLGIASGLWATPADLKAYRHDYAVTIPLTLDASGELFRAFGVSNVPAALVIDAQGRIVRRVEGADLTSAAVLGALTRERGE